MCKKGEICKSDIDSELTAELVGDYLFTDQGKQQKAPQKAVCNSLLWNLKMVDISLASKQTRVF